VTRVLIPRTAVRRGELCYALLLLRVYPRRTFNAFEGTYFRCGAEVDETALRPAPEYPAVPLLLEYAGNDKTGRGHKRSNDIYVLWRYDPARRVFAEILRSLSQGRDWIDNIRPAAIRLLAPEKLPDADLAARVSGLVLGQLDTELEKLDVEHRSLVMHFVYEQFTARAVAFPSHRS